MNLKKKLPQSEREPLRRFEFPKRYRPPPSGRKLKSNEFKQCFNGVITKYMNKTFILSDESLNSYGFKVLTSGINLKRFKENPVMFYNHNRELGVIGRWENIRVEGSRLLADPVFDEADEFARKIKNKVDNGFVKSASIGFFTEEQYTLKDNERWIMNCQLNECSIVDMPSNENAMVLYDKNDKRVLDVNEYFLSLSSNPRQTTSPDLLNRLAKTLLIQEISEENVLKEINSMLDELNPNGVKNRLKNALKLGIIDQQQFCSLLDMGNNNPAAFDSYFSKVETDHKENIQKRYEQYFKDNPNKFIPMPDRNKFKRLAEMDFDIFLTVMDHIPDHQSLSSKIVPPGSTKGIKANWKLKEYRKFAPDELRRDPELYQRLLEEQQNDKQ